MQDNQFGKIGWKLLPFYIKTTREKSVFCLYAKVMHAITMKPPWKSSKIVLNRGWICLKLSNLPESVPIWCAVELIELPFLPRTTEAQETLGPKPQTMVLCLRGAHGWSFYTQTCVTPMFDRMIKNSVLFQSRSCICLLLLGPAPHFMNRTFYYTWKQGKPFSSFDYLNVKTHRTHHLFLLNRGTFKMNHFFPWTKEQGESRWGWCETWDAVSLLRDRLEKRGRDGDSQMTLLERYLPGAAHLGCAAAKDKACALISGSSNLKYGEEDMFCNIPIMSNIQGEGMPLMYACVHVCEPQQGLQCHGLVLLWKSIVSFKHNLHRGPRSVRQVSQEKLTSCASEEHWVSSWSEGLCLELR